jgi:heat-inducible transcriptional repressor
LKDNPLTDEEKKLIQSYFDTKLIEIDDIIKKTAKVISDITNYTSVIVLKNIKEIKIRNIKLVDIGEGLALVIIVTDSGVISDKTIKILFLQLHCCNS